MTKKFSIIIPAYNAEEYLGRCLDSLLKQNLSIDEYEILVVNDGSTDGTWDIVRKYAGNFSNIRAFSTENKGVSEARNYACSQAIGEYFIFVDADDWIKEDTLSLLYTKMKDEHLDLLVTNYRYWNKDGEQPRALHYTRKCKDGMAVCSGQEFMQQCLPPVVWGIVYRLSYWQKHNFRFLPIRHEDEELIPRVFYFADRVNFLSIDFYNYYQHPGSFMMNYDERSCMYMLRAMESVERFRREYVEGEKMNYFFQNLIAKNLLKALKRSIQWGAPAKIQLQMITEMNKIGLTPLPKDKSIFYTWLYNISPALFLRYYRIKLKKVSR